MEQNRLQEWLTGTRPYEEGVQLYQQFGSDALLKRLFQEGWSEFKERKLCQLLEALAALPVLPDVYMAPVPGIGGIKPVEMVAAKDFTPVLEVKQLQAENEYLADEVSELEDQNQELQDEVADLQEENTNLKERSKRLRFAGWPVEMDETLQILHRYWKPLIAEKYNLQARIYDVAKRGQKDDASREQARIMALRILELRKQCRAIYDKRDHYLNHGELPREAPKPSGISTEPKEWPLKLANAQKYLRDYKAKYRKEDDAEKRQAIQVKINEYEAVVAEYKKLLGI